MGHGDRVNRIGYIEVFHGDTKLMLDLAGEYTIYFGDWHGHYYTDEIRCKFFDETLNREFLT